MDGGFKFGGQCGFEADDGFAGFADFTRYFDTISCMRINQFTVLLVNLFDGGKAVGMGRFAGNKAILLMYFV